MGNFKFVKKDNKFRWESNFMALEFSAPSIQGFSDYINLTDEKEIMYYYYTVKVFKRITTWNKNDDEVEKWKLVSERSTHDFPSITELKWILDYQLKDNTIKNGQKIEYTSGAVRYSKVMATEGFACDDFYEITKSVDKSGKNDRYIVYCGTTFDLNGDLNSAGIRTPYVDREDIEELLKCVSEFIQYSLDLHNDRVKLWANCYEVKNNKVYEYNYETGTVDKNKVESIFAVGDNVDITTVVDNKEYDNDRVIISKIEDNKIFLDNGQVIDGTTIVYMHNNVTEEMLKYKEDAIAKDFLSVLSDEEKEEFKNNDVDSLLDKYKMAIIDRTWMCRDEHEFDMDYKHGERVVKVTPIVKKVINMIKDIVN